MSACDAELLEIIDTALERPSPLVRRFAQLISPDCDLSALAQQAERLTRQHFGKTMRLFAPLYLSNECVNICKYCGFSRDNPILRVTLKVDQVEAEARHLYAQGFRNILLVAGEHPKFVSNDYMAQCVERLQQFIPSVSIEVGPMETEEYLPVVHAGAEGLVVYQETYHRPTYTEMHTAGPKKDFAWRLACPQRGYEAGFRRLGIGALLGLWDWREEAIKLAAHAEYLLKKCWKSYLTISLPRLRPAAGEFEPLVHVSEREYAQIIMALRVCFPQVGLVLSTRETPKLRDGLMKLGITMMSAGAHTEPGGYTGVGTDDLHQTVKGKRVDLQQEPEVKKATEQFLISDQRSAQEVAERIRQMGLDPVWKDWDACITGKAA